MGATAGENDADLAALLGQRRWQEAHALCMDRLSHSEDDSIALSGLATIAEVHGNLAQAEAIVARCRGVAPEDPRIAARHARLLSILSRPKEAEDAADAALALGPSGFADLETIGVVLSRAERHAEAASIFARAVAERPDHAAGLRNLGNALRFCGQLDEAEVAYDRALELEPDDAETLLAKVGLRRQVQETAPVRELEALWEKRGDDPDLALRIGHALAKIAEDLGNRDRAMAWLAVAKRPKAQAVRHDPDRTDALYAAAMRTCTSGDLPSGSVAGPAPIFVVGAPRTGTTLVDRILSSHSRAVSIGESGALSLAVKRLSDTRSHHALDEETLIASRSVRPDAIARAYLEAIGPQVPAGQRSVDKMPLNLLYAGIAHRALPDARIVRLRRHPLDAVLANWRQLFAPRAGNYDHNWSLEHVARWIVAVERVGARWRATLPTNRYCEVRYEDIVLDQERMTRALLQFCDLDFEEACLRFHENPAPVSTASAVQVREPLHARSIGAWRAVERHLAPAIAVLRDAGLIGADGALLDFQ